MKTLLLKTIPLFSELKDHELQKVAELCVLKKFRRDNLIIFEDDLGNNLFLIKSGRVKISRISEDGREVILAILNEGDFFGELSLIDGMTRSANVIALGDVEVLILRRGDFLDLLSKYPTIAVSLVKELAARIRKSDSQIQSLSLMSAEGRVITTLIRLAEDIGTIQKGEVRITNLPCQRDLANIAGTSRETISRFIKKFERQGLLKKDKGELIIFDYDRFKQAFL